MSLPSSPALVVGIGASAGGVEALQVFFAHVPADSGCAYVVILHLSPTHESQLAPLIQAVTPIPVTTVAASVRVEPDHVYVVPPNQHLAMLDGELRVSPNLEPEDRRAPIDIFFRTLADSHDGRGVCVVLSGSGADGSMGLKRVKERGGAVFVQSPREATFAEMPRAAITTDLVDDVLPVAEIPARVITYRASIGSIAIPEEPEQRPEEQQQALRELFAQIRLRTGHDFSEYKRPTVLRRIARRISVRNLPDLPAYVAYLHDQPDEVQALLKDLLISVTNFFRDKDAFAALDREVLPHLFQDKHAGDTVRIWVIGCATGEEAYSVAMLCAERTLDTLDAPGVQIFATDIDEAAIANARAGLYTAADIADISPERLRRFFTREDERYRVRSELREMVLFAAHNILKDPPFSHIDLITCRNVLIYLNRTAQERALELLHFALNPGGYLFLGTAESADSASDLFTIVSRQHRLFRHRPTGPRPIPLPEPAPGRLLAPPPVPAPLSRSVRPLASEQLARERVSFEGLHLRLLEQYAAPSLVVTEEFEVVHLSEQAGRFLHIAAGVPSTNLLDLVRPELRSELRAALYQALQHQANVDIPALPVHIDDRPELITLRVRPVLRRDDPARGFLLVLFEAGTPGPASSEEVIRSDEGRARQLEDEVTRLRQQLRSSAEQYEYQAEEHKATNEELQALVEELRSSSEELHTSKEELQSLNEELRTVNQELKVKVEEATQTSANLQNLVNASAIATIFLDRGMRVRLFTPAAQALFNLIAADHGRPLSDITHRLLAVDVLDLAQRVLATLQTLEQEVRANDGQVYVLRVLPYRVGEDRIGGVVLTFFDITARTQAEQTLRENQQRQVFLLKLSDALRPLSDPIAIQAAVTRIALEDFNADRCYYCEIDDGKAIIRHDAARDGLPSVVGEYALASMPIFKAVVDAGRPVVVEDAHTTELLDESLRQLCVQLQVISFVDVPVIKDGKPVGLLCVTQSTRREWTAFEVELAVETAERTWAAVERARAETALHESEMRYRTLFTTIDEAFALCEIIRDADGAPVDYRLLEVNPAFEQMTGITPAAAAGSTGRELVPGLEDWWIETYGRVALQGEVARFENRVAGMDRWFDVYASPMGEQGNGRFVVVFQDITGRKRVEEQLRRAADLDAFRVTLADALRPLADPLEIQQAAARVLGQHLAADRVLYADADGDAAPRDPGTPRAALSVGETFVATDAEGLPAAERKALLALGARSCVVVPLIKQGRRVSHLGVYHGAPRAWTADEVRLVKEAAARVGAALEQARAEAAVRASEERFRAFIMASSDVVYQMNADWSEMRSLVGRDFIPDTDNPNSSWLDTYIHPDDRAQVLQVIDDAIRTKSVFELEHRVVQVDGSLGWTHSRAIPLLNAAGEITQWLGTARDITQRKRAEQAVERANAELEQRVQERTAALTASNQARQELLRQLVTAQEEERLRLARDLHDQLGQQITGLLLGLKQLEEPAQGTPLAAMLPPLQNLATELAKDAHRLATNLRPTALDDVGLVPALEWLVTDWGRQAEIGAAFHSRGLEAGRLPLVLETVLYRVVQEALTNVRKHAAARNVSVLLERRGGEVLAIVEDDGRGFEPEAVPVNPERPALGLRGMRERVAQLGGSLELESSPGVGTTVFVRVPLEVQPQRPESPSAS